MKNIILSLFAALLVSGCAGGSFSSGVKTVHVNPAVKRGTVVTAPDKATVFAQTAQSQTQWLENWLRNAIVNQINQSGRFSAIDRNPVDATIEFESVRHGLIEVSAGSYAATLDVDVILLDRNGKTTGHRTVSATGGSIHSLRDFEDAKVYSEALSIAADKLALELVSTL
jgi:hypothetical protein